MTWVPPLTAALVTEQWPEIQEVERRCRRTDLRMIAGNLASIAFSITCAVTFAAMWWLAVPMMIVACMTSALLGRALVYVRQRRLMYERCRQIAEHDVTA